LGTRGEITSKYPTNIKAMNKTHKLIGLTGFAGSGKDSVRLILERDHNYHGLAFADPMRLMLFELLTSAGLSSNYMHSRDLKEAPIPELGVSYRHMAQTLGTEWGRNTLHPDFWIRLAAAYVNDCARHSGTAGMPIVVSDVRFLNEALWIKQQGGQLWRVDRPNLPPVRSHQSEREIDTLVHNQWISNWGTLEDLELQVRMALEGKL
jgi:hypothetical protein